MSEPLVTTIEQRRSGARLVRLTGVLDEHNKLGELVDKLGAGNALINLAGVDRINSAGVRDWVKWLSALEAKGTRPVLIACSPAVVEQLNRVPELAGHAVIKSFMLPYACATCHVDKRMLVHVVDMKAPYVAPSHACDACGTEMGLVVDATQYFAFLANVQPVAVQASMEPTPSDRSLDGRDSSDGSWPGAELARGSRTSSRNTPRTPWTPWTPLPDAVVRIAQTPEHVRTSQARLRQTQPSLSAFQLPDVRYSERDIAREDPNRNDKRYILAILALLFAALAVFAFLLLA
jgi:anti-anti-sigma regulatory factor